MRIQDLFQRIFHFNMLSNLQLVEALRALSREKAEEQRLISHVLLAEKIWLLRLDGYDTGAVDVWATLDWEEAAQLARINGEAYRSFLARIDDSSLYGRTQYSTQQGDVWKNTVADILTHVSHHGSHHRGQINRLLREKGDAPLRQDFIVYARENREEAPPQADVRGQ
jgi:uncharacterized damage-inducible protein DinB